MTREHRTQLRFLNNDIEHRKDEDSANSHRDKTHAGAKDTPPTDDTIQHDETKATGAYCKPALTLNPCASKNAESLIHRAGVYPEKDSRLSQPPSGATTSPQSPVPLTMPKRRVAHHNLRIRNTKQVEGSHKQPTEPPAHPPKSIRELQ